jgi:hypothetical protein
MRFSNQDASASSNMLRVKQLQQQHTKGTNAWDAFCTIGRKISNDNRVTHLVAKRCEEIREEHADTRFRATPFLTVRVSTGFDSFLAVLAIDAGKDIEAVSNEISRVVGDTKTVAMSAEEAGDLAQDMRLPMIVITDMQHDGSEFGAVFRKYVE